MLKIRFLFPLILCVFIITIIGYQPVWQQQISGDIQNYYQPSGDYLALNKLPALVSITNILIYPPGANILFSLLSLVNRLANFQNSYQFLFVGTQILAIFLLYWIYFIKNGDRPNRLGFLLILLASGPLILFRFDMVVILLIASSIYYFQKSAHFTAGFFIALAISLKIFPLLLLPYFCLLLILRRNFRGLVLYSLSIVVTTAIILLAYVFLFRQDFLSIQSGIGYHFVKAVHVESIYGSFLTIVALFKHPIPPPIEFTNGVFGLSWQYLLGHKRIFNYLGTLGILITYFFIALRFIKFRSVIKFELTTLITIVTCIVATSQVISPQYLYWPLFLIPGVGFNLLKDRFWKVNLIMLLAIALLTQIVYPLNYNRLVFAFYGARHDEWIFWVLTARNFLFLAFTVRLFYRYILSAPEIGDATKEKVVKQ